VVLALCHFLLSLAFVAGEVPMFRFKLFLVVSVLALASGCATFRDGASPSISKWPPGSVSSAAKSVSLRVSGSALENNLPVDVNPKSLDAWKKLVKETYVSSGLFSSVKADSADADLVAEVNVLDKGEANSFGAFMTGYTFFLIPTHARSGFVLKTTFKNRAGDNLGSIEKSEFADTWIQLLLFPVMFFKSPGSVYANLFMDLNRNTLIEAKGKGYF
jgi:hypothetical protein